MEIAKQANAVVKKAVEIFKESDKDAAVRFETVNTIFNNASGMTNGNAYCEAMLKGWMVSQANNAVFNLWRKGLMTSEIEEAYRELPSTEEAVKEYDEYEDEAKKIAEEIEDQRRAFMEKQQGIDIFKAILNGMSKEQAEAQYEEYKKKLSQATQG